MNAENILSDVPLTNLDHREAQFVRAELIEKIAAAIAAEREECAKVAASMIGATRKEIAAAIRARNGSK